jgi:hypothetical protein
MLEKVPALGRGVKFAIDGTTMLIYGFFIVSLIGSGLSIILSVVAIFKPQLSVIYGVGAAATIITGFPMGIATFLTSTIASFMTKSINGLSDTLGLTATKGDELMAFIWISFFAFNLMQTYWATVWFVEFRQRAYKARERTMQEMGDYKGVAKELLSDIRLPKVPSYDRELLKVEDHFGTGKGARSRYNQI